MGIKTIINYSKSNLLEFLQTLPIFDGVNKDELLNLLKKTFELHFKKGELIRMAGERPDAFYLIFEGMVNVSKISSKGKEFTIDCRFKGDNIGWGQVLRGGVYTANYYALDDTIILSFDKEIFINFMKRNPIMQSRIGDLNIDLINKLFNKLIDVACDTANNRLIRTLIHLNERCGDIINLTHLEVAKMSWTTIETSTRVLTRLRHNNIISTDRGKIIIKNSEKLHHYIE